VSLFRKWLRIEGKTTNAGMELILLASSHVGCVYDAKAHTPGFAPHTFSHGPVPVECRAERHCMKL
jgi:hypothetical protein